jgi:hypothetical protein
MEDTSKNAVKQAAAQTRWPSHNEAKQRVGAPIARRIGAQPIVVAGIRGALIDILEASLQRLVGADTEVYDFSVERDRLSAMLADLRAGRDICVQGWKIPRELRPANGKVLQLIDDKLVPDA